MVEQFNNVFLVIRDVLKSQGINIDDSNYDGIAIKQLKSSNTLTGNDSTHQTHIAITGKQMDIFPYLKSDGYFNENDNNLKNYFVFKVFGYLYKKNIEYLDNNSAKLYENDIVKIHTIVTRSKRDTSEQMQLSQLSLDDERFVGFRRLLNIDYFLIILKRKEKFEYDFFGIKNTENEDIISSLKNFNGYFYKKKTTTVISINNMEGLSDNVIENKKENSSVDILEVKRDKIKNKKIPLNLIVYGAPGTSKTYNMPNYAIAAIDNADVNLEQDRIALLKRYKEFVKKGQIVFTTFHQNYGYEDFIEGLRPDTNSSQLSFKTVDGVFKKIANKAIQDNDNRYVIIIDEINRGNISKIFGELITLIEEDKRWGEDNEMSATLPSGRNFAVPNNLYIIGTMNSADKSISLIDAALRRRFSFEEMVPDSRLIGDNKLKSIFEKMNLKLNEMLESSDLLIGHSYFIGKTIADFNDIMNKNIVPLLYEYLYDNKNKVRKFLTDVFEDTEYIVKDNKFGRLTVEKGN